LAAFLEVLGALVLEVTAAAAAAVDDDSEPAASEESLDTIAEVIVARL
jgi:hypothetical protein